MQRADKVSLQKIEMAATSVARRSAVAARPFGCQVTRAFTHSRGHQLGATTWHIAAIFAVGGLGNVLMGPQAGKLSDRIGRKGIILVSCVGLSLVMLVTVPVMRSLWVAYPLFFVIMLLVAMRMSPFSALLTALVPDERRGSLMSMTVALGQLGLAIGAAIAGPLFTGLGFWSNSVGGAVAVLGMGLMVWFLVPEPSLEAPVEAARMEEAAVEEAG